MQKNITDNKYIASFYMKRPYGTEFYAGIIIDTAIPRGRGLKRDQNIAWTGEAKWSDPDNALKEAAAKIVELNQ